MQHEYILGAKIWTHSGKLDVIVYHHGRSPSLYYYGTSAVYPLELPLHLTRVHASQTTQRTLTILWTQPDHF